MKVILSKPVNRARSYKQPIVALESTIITQGMPYPKNVETALQVKRAVIESGATPATIAIINGQLKAGLTDEEITFMGKNAGQFVKTSRRDIPYLVAKKKNGATTVAATMIIAAMAGIKVFATGGIGGVHRGAAQSMDISADLQELARTSVAVVSAGAKSILDLELTREYLETQGVPLIGYGTEELPAFYSRKSGLSVDYRLNTPREVANFLQTKWELGLQGGVVVANPIPEAYEMEYAPINEAIETALKEATDQQIKGKAITPFLLSRIEQLTGGQSLQANIQLVLNNARLAAAIAREL
jgi:pseudouridine-5'-phosphate glycosidase